MLNKTSAVPLAFPLMAIVVLFGALPFVYTTTTLDPNIHIRSLILSAALSLFFMLNAIMLRSCPASIRLTKMGAWTFLAAMFYCFGVVISLIRAINHAEAIFDATRACLSLALLTALTWLVLIEDRIVMIAARTITAAALLQSAIGLMQYFNVGFTWIPGSYEPYGAIGHSHLYASYLLLSSPFSLFLYSCPNKMWRGLSAAALILSLVCIVLTTSRAVWLAAFGAACITIGLRFLFKRPDDSVSKIIKKLTAPSLIIVAALTVLALTGQIKVRTGDSCRFLIWKKTADMVAAHLPWGVGAGNWKINFAAYGIGDLPENVAEGWTNFVRPHNEFLLVLSETGLLGIIGWLLFFIFILIIIIRAGRQAIANEHSSLVFLMMFGVLSYLIASSFSFERERVEHNIMLMFMAAVSIGRLDIVRVKPVEISRRWIALIAIIFIVVSSGGVYLSGQRMRAEIHVSSAALARMNGDWTRVLRETEKADSKFYTVDPTAVPVRWYRGVSNFTLGNIAEAKKDFEAALSYNPHHLHSLVNLAACFAREGETEKAIECYLQALKISSYYKEALLNLSAVYYNAGRCREAYQTITAIPSAKFDEKANRFLEKIKEKYCE